MSMTTQQKNPLYKYGWHLNEDKQCYEMFVFDEVVASIAKEEIETSEAGIHDLMILKRREAQKKFKENYSRWVQRT